MPSRKKLYLLKLKDDGKKRKIVVNIEFTPLPHCNMLPFQKVFKDHSQNPQTIGKI